MTDIFEIQDDIVRELVSVLQIRLGVGAGSGRVRSHNVDTEAYESYLQGLYLWANRHIDDNRVMAIRSLRLATEIDPNFADAWAAYALSLIHSATPERQLPPGQSTSTIHDALMRALEINPDTARAHSGLAMYYGEILFDLEKSLLHAERAIALAPNAASSHYASASAAIVRGDHETARIEMQRARRLDPLNRVIARVEAQHQLLTGHVEEAGRFFRQCETSDCEGESTAQLHMADFEWLTGQREASLSRISKLLERITQGNTGYVELMGSDSLVDELVYFHRVMSSDTTAVSVPENIGASISTRVHMLTALIEAREYDKTVELLRRAYAEDGAFPYGFTLYLLAPGSFEFAEAFRKYPGYREFWTQPGLAQLAATRIANGRPEGLPLNDDGTPVEY